MPEMSHAERREWERQRKAAYRARLARGEVSPQEEREHSFEVADRILFESGHLDEETYVRREVFLTAEAIRSGLKDLDGKRLARSEAYARWRYRAYQTGEVAFL